MPPGCSLLVARVVVRLSRHALPSPSILGAFVVAVRTDRGLSLGQLARRYGCGMTTVRRWMHAGGPTAQRIRAAVALHAHHVANGVSMKNVPHYLPRMLRLSRGASAPLVAREVAATFGVTAAQLRSSSRREPLPEARRAVARKAHALGATQAAIARELRVDAAHVSRLIGGAL